jgi:creatinine amidohydrolase/Fe(II)-dependent formamide hydrolase-like protein
LMSTDLSQATDLSCSVAPLIYPSPSDHHPSHPRTRWVLDGWPVSSNMASWKIHLL